MENVVRLKRTLSGYADIDELCFAAVDLVRQTAVSISAPHESAHLSWKVTIVRTL